MTAEGRTEPLSSPSEAEWIRQIPHALNSLLAAFRALIDALKQVDDLLAGGEAAWHLIATRADELCTTAERARAQLVDPPAGTAAGLQQTALKMIDLATSAGMKVKDGLKHPDLFVESTGGLASVAGRMGELSEEITSTLERALRQAGSQAERPHAPTALSPPGSSSFWNEQVEFWAKRGEESMRRKEGSMERPEEPTPRSEATRSGKKSLTRRALDPARRARETHRSRREAIRAKELRRYREFLAAGLPQNRAGVLSKMAEGPYSVVVFGLSKRANHSQLGASLRAHLGYEHIEVPILLERVEHIAPETVAFALEQSAAVELKKQLDAGGAKVRIEESVQRESQHRPGIPKSVRREVWRRDEGRCVDCESEENLEYDHTIPISKGGANTARNIQLRCERCNRSKGAKI